MGKEILTFGDIETEKKKVLLWKSYCFRRCRYGKSISVYKDFRW